MSRQSHPIFLLTVLSSLFFGILVFISGCGGKAGTNGKMTIESGKRIELANKTITPEGGNIIVNDGGPLNGLEIDVPENAYSRETKFTISYSDVSNCDCGPDFHPVSPLISIASSEGNSDSLMTISFPVHLKRGQFAMAFIYDEARGQLEGMPLLASDTAHVVVATNNFSSHARSANVSKLAAQVGGGQEEDEEKIIISAASEQSLMGDFDSDFTPGVDDCPFTNYGSMLEPGGQCSGQSLLAMWYFAEKKKEKGTPLFQLLDNDGQSRTPGFWQDDADGIKIASLLESDFTILGFVPRMVFRGGLLAGQILTPDKITMNAFRYAIKITHQPQLLELSETAATRSGHAVVLYKIEGNVLYVADPNFPGALNRRIVYDDVNESFLPYNSGENASNTNTKYHSIFYMAKSAMVPWATAAAHWQEFEDKNIGHGKFPDFTISALNDSDEFVPLDDGFQVPGTGNLVLSVKTPGFKTKFLVFDAAGRQLAKDGSSVQLGTGQQRIGINLLDENNYWAGFKWVDVVVLHDENPPTEPAKGKIQLSLRINGEPVNIDSAIFSSDLTFSLEGYGPRDYEGNTAWPHYVIIHALGWHGLGNYPLSADDGGTYVGQADKTYYMDAGKQGQLIISHWDNNGSVTGTFSFDALDRDGNTKHVDGSFHR